MPAKKKAQTDRPTFNIAGGVHANRDAILGDQYNYGGQTQQIANIHSAAEFVAELREIQSQLSALKTAPELDAGDVQMVEIAAGRLQEIAAEAQEPEPALDRITTALDKVKKTLDALGGSVASAAGLGAALAGLIEIAKKLFGG
jgi:hypothetical protein